MASAVVRMICRHLNNSYSVSRFFISLRGPFWVVLFRTARINHPQAAYVMVRQVFRYIQTFITITKAKEHQEQDKLPRINDLQLRRWVFLTRRRHNQATQLYTKINHFIPLKNQRRFSSSFIFYLLLLQCLVCLLKVILVGTLNFWIRYCKQHYMKCTWDLKYCLHIRKSHVRG